MDTYQEPSAGVRRSVGSPPFRLSPSQPAWLQLRLIILVAATMLPLFLLIAVIVLGSYRNARSVAGERVLQTTRGAMAMVDRELDNHIAQLQVLALSPALRDGDLKTFRAEAERFLSRYEGQAAVSISVRNGQVILSTRLPEGDPLPVRSDREAVETVFTKKTPYVSDIYIGRIVSRPVFTVDVPVIRGDEVIYDLAFNPPRQNFTNMLANLSLPEGWIVSILDRNGHHIARLPSLDEEAITSASETLLAELKKGEREGIAETVSVEGTPILSAFARSGGTGWVVAIGMPVEALMDPARQALYASIGVGAVLMLIALVFASRLASQVARAEGQRESLVNELNHRVKNTLASVQAIVSSGLRHSEGSRDVRNAIEARLVALSHVHNILSSRKWESADLRELTTAVLNPYIGHGTRAHLQGPAITLKPQAAIAWAMILNELVTNAVKYGALSVPQGVVDLSWTHLESGRVRIDWRESGGPPAQQPTRIGYGTKFIERAVAGELQGQCTVAYLPQGLTCTLEIQV